MHIALTYQGAEISETGSSDMSLVPAIVDTLSQPSIYFPRNESMHLLLLPFTAYRAPVMKLWILYEHQRVCYRV